MPGQRLPQIIDGQFIHTHYNSVLEHELEHGMAQHSPSDQSSSLTPPVTLDSGDSNYATDANLSNHRDNTQGQQHAWAQQQQPHVDMQPFQWVSPSYYNSGPINGSGALSLEASHTVIQAGQQPGHDQLCVDSTSQQGQQAPQVSFPSQFIPSQVWLFIIGAHPDL